RRAGCPAGYGEVPAAPRAGELSEGVEIMNWPQVELTDVERFRALAAGVPGAAVTERVLPYEPGQVKAMLADLDVFAEIHADLESATLLERDGDRVVVRAKGARGQRARLE